MIAKTEEDIVNLRTAGKILADTLRMLAEETKAGVTLASLDLLAEKAITEAGAKPAFLGYKPEGAAYPYPATLCVSLNEEVVHGIPTEEKIIKEGDLVSLDLGLSYNGYFVDSAVTVVAGEGTVGAKKLITATREALDTAIKAAKVGGHLGDIGAAVERVAKKYSFTVVEDLGGHAVGRKVHEKPFIGNEGKVGEGEKIVEGMVLALEPMFAEGKGAIVTADDEWTLKMKDGKRAAHYEHTILVTKDGPEVLTA